MMTKQYVSDNIRILLYRHGMFELIVHSTTPPIRNGRPHGDIDSRTNITSFCDTAQNSPKCVRQGKPRKALIIRKSERSVMRLS